jgi:hypothetical protein
LTGAITREASRIGRGATAALIDFSRAFSGEVDPVYRRKCGENKN